MAVTILHTGADWRFSLTVKDESDAVVSLVPFGNYVAFFYIHPDNVAVKFSKTAQTGYILTVAVDEVNGEFDCIVPAATTAEIPDGELYVQVKVQLPTAGYVDISIAKKIGQVKNVDIEAPISILF